MKRSLGRMLAVAAVLVPVCSSAETAEFAASRGTSDFIFAAASPSINFGAARGMSSRPAATESFYVDPGAYGAPFQVVPLAPLLDGASRSKATFLAGNTVVHVFGGKSENKKNWFVAFAPEGGETQFIYSHKMIHWMGLVNRTVTLTFAGQAYAAYIEGKETDKPHSRLVVAPADASGPESAWTAQEISDAAYETGVPVTIGGKEYRLMYWRDFNENQGRFAGYSGDRSISLMGRDDDGKPIAYHWMEKDIPGDHILVSTPRICTPDDDDVRPGTLTIGLRLNAGALEFYSIPAN